MSSSGAGMAAEGPGLNVLIVEDSEADAELLVLELRRGGFRPAFRRVDTPHTMAAALEDGHWDVILSDYSMPQFTLEQALSMVQARGQDVPFLIVSATIGEEAAVDAMKAGAHDYILKHKLGRLVPAVRRELNEAQVRRERRTLEEQLRQAQKLESLGVLAGGVAHDFNNLLTGILGNASLVLETLRLPEPERSMLEEVIRASERAAELTRQLLAYAGKGRFVLEPVDLSELVRELSYLVRSSVPRQVELRLELQPDPPLIEADPSQLQQVVMNLALNAAEAIGDQHGTVEIVTGALPGLPGEGSDSGAWVLLKVRDNGCGMDDATRSRIFDPFFTTKFTGRGLGLAAVEGIVRSHRGSIQVESAPGRGSTFEVRLPAIERPSYAPQPRVAPETPGGLEGSGRILVIDDEAVVRWTARAALDRYGYSVVEAENGREGVEILRRMPDLVSLVLLDLTMPVMGGEETYRQLKSIRPDIPVVVSSGYEEAEAARRFGDIGVANFIQKPYVAQKLARCIREALGRREAATG